MATVIIPAALRKHTHNVAKCNVEAEKVSELIIKMTDQFPDLKKHLINADGFTPSFINIFVNEDDIRHLNNGETKIMHNSVVTIVPAIAGG